MRNNNLDGNFSNAFEIVCSIQTEIILTEIEERCI